MRSCDVGGSVARGGGTEADKLLVGWRENPFLGLSSGLAMFERRR